jgi:DNA-binding PadR family transcriptional regulator
MSDLSLTSFALLALLSIRSWSAYELTSYMRESTLRAVWPRAASHIYSELKRLEKDELASSEEARQGGRKRSVYSITPEGREALRSWVEYADEYVADWSDGGMDPETEARGGESYAQSLERVRELLSAWRGE